MRTHYDNLHIPRDADDQTIQQAYRRLSKQYHPDLNPDPDANRIMQIINRAYEVLSDPVARAEHDRWIQAQENLQNRQRIAAQTAAAAAAAAMAAAAAARARQPENARAAQQPRPTPQPAATPKRRSRRVLITLLCTVLFGIFVWQIIVLWQAHRQPEKSLQNVVADSLPLPDNAPASDILSADNTTAAPSSSAQKYIRPATAPNGAAFPQESGYISGYSQTRSAKGRYRIDVDNVRNTSDVFAELYRDGQERPLRTFFIQERSQLELDGLDAGTYSVRYLQLDDGETVNSENLTLSGSLKEGTIYLQRAKENDTLP